MPEMTKEQQKERIRRRVKAAETPAKSTCSSEQENTDYIKPVQSQRVSIYVRVSTGDPGQDTSLDLRQKYCMDYGRSLAKTYPNETPAGVNESVAEMEENPDA